VVVVWRCGMVVATKGRRRRAAVMSKSATVRWIAAGWVWLVWRIVGAPTIRAPVQSPAHLVDEAKSVVS
jgi:hypothetical protein